jgi:hypothetical protein
MELVMVVGVVAVAVALLSVAGAGARHRARTAGSIANLQKFASGITSFAADNEDRIATFTWRAGAPARRDRTGYTFPIAATDSQAGADQAVAIMRWYADRRDITQITGWIAHIFYSHLALIEHMEHRLPAEFVVSPHDLNRLAWQRSVRNMEPGENGAAFFALTNRPAGSSNNEKRWAYSSSYEFVPASFSPDARVITPNGTVATVSQDVMGHRWYTAGSSTMPWGQRRVSEVAHPSKKVLVFETHPSGDGGSLGNFYGSSKARPPMLFADGSVVARSMVQANAGFQPNVPFSASPTRINYTPELSWEPPTVSGAASEFVNGKVRWTRSGLLGRDFDGPEVPWPQ